MSRDSGGYVTLRPGDKVRNTVTGQTGTVVSASKRHDVHVDTGVAVVVWDHPYVEPAEAGS
jgi:hypothetical protein